MEYSLRLLAGLEILERHPHSRDIYTSKTRYAPLGSDATVAYGFKDLRVLNAFSVPVCFRVSLSQEKVSCSVCCPEPIEAAQIEFARTATEAGVTLVETRRHLRGRDGYSILGVSGYRSLDSGCRPDERSAH